MEYKNLLRIKKVRKKKRILLLNPRRKTCEVSIPHMGLAILAAILKKRGHEVLVVDYQLIHSAPRIFFFIKRFKPDVIGLSIITANTKEAMELLREIRGIDKKIPVLVGGPHVTLYYDNLEKNRDIDYIIIGEAEPVIIDIVENVRRQDNAKIIKPKTIIDPNKLPYADYKSFYKWEHIRSYPIMTSRGCPYRCSFCPVLSLSAKKWRPRDPEDCIRELEIAMKELNPNLHVLIQDDNPLVVPERFYKFLDTYSRRIKMRLAVTNVRADNVNDALLNLLKKSGCHSIGLGVESANPEVFRLVNKGETLETIDKAARLVKKHGLTLSFCFIIGLPEDNIRRIKDSIKFAKKHKPDAIYWNMVMPYKNTAVRVWFEKKGRLYDEVGKTSLIDGDFKCEEPSVETLNFTVYERKKAHYMCLFETVDERLKLRKLPQIFIEAVKYRLYGEFFYWLPRGIIKSVKRKIELLQKAHAYSHREGISNLIKRTLFLVRGE